MALLVPLVVILRRKRRRIARRERVYREGTPTLGAAIELKRVTMKRASWWLLEYGYQAGEGEPLEGAATAASREDLEHLERDDITILYLPEDPQQSILYWDE